MFYDAHNHLQKLAERPDFAAILAATRSAGVGRMVVNGTCEADWPAVAALARAYPEWIVPAFGLHPWEVAGRSDGWLSLLAGYLEAFPGAVVGEVGLDRRVKDFDSETQESVFLAQWRLGVAMNRPVQVHCLRAFGALDALLARESTPDHGWLLHSYGGPVEMVPGFVRKGASFSFSGYFLEPRKVDGRLAAFRAVPRERLMVETDAPDMAPPRALRTHALDEASPEANHPANLGAVLTGLAEGLGLTPESLASITTENARRYFG